MDTEGATILKIFHDLNEADPEVLLASCGEVDVEIAKFEADALVDSHIDRYKDQVRETVLEDLRKMLRTKFRLKIQVKADELRRNAESQSGSAPGSECSPA